MRYQTAPRSDAVNLKKNHKLSIHWQWSFLGLVFLVIRLELTLLLSPFAHCVEDLPSDAFTKTDDLFFLAALREAQKAMGTTHPNPSVGAVLVRKNTLLATGHTQPVGGWHAEITALGNTQEPLTSATLYVTLEPCCHHGRTPPCTDAIIQAGIKRVVYGALDPNPLVSGKGIEALTSAQITVDAIENPRLKTTALLLMKPFTKWMVQKRPYVVIKIATSRDGKIAHQPGMRTKITNQNSDLVVHTLRTCVDGVMVGKNTTIIDNPQLTARLVETDHQPVRIVLDTHLECSPALNIFDTRCAKTMLLTSEQAALPKKTLFTNQGVNVMSCAMDQDHLDLDEALIKLGSLGFTSILVEAGQKLFNAFMDKKLADEIWWFKAPHHIGPSGLDLLWSQDDIKQQGYVPSETFLRADDELVVFHQTLP